MNKELKDTVEVLAANGGALGITLTQCNELLQMFDGKNLDKEVISFLKQQNKTI